MGFFKKLFRLFQPVIECPNKHAEDLLYIAPLKKSTIKLGTTLLVREHFMAILAVRNHATDFFITGKHKLILGAMPNTARKVNFRMRKKDKKPRDNFKGEIYFINLKIFEDKFNGTEPILLKDINLGKVKGRAGGFFSYQISDPKRFLEVCFLNWAYVKIKKINKKLRLWVVEEVVKELEKLSPPLLDFAKNEPYLTEAVTPSLEKKLKSFGITLYDFKITETYVPNKFVAALLEYSPKDFLTYDENKKDDALINFEEEDYSYKNIIGGRYDMNEIAYGNNVKEMQKEPSHILIENAPNYETNKKLCFYCRAMIDKSANICYNCGKKQVKKRVCPHCNCEIEEGEFVCPNCRNMIL